MPQPDIGSVPFKEAIEYFKKKRIVSTARWDQMLGEQHGRAFTVAGAMKADLLQDLKNAIADIQQNGGTLNDFRKLFDKIVARHGWSYNGKRGWRTKVIFDTNIKTARAAGRWEQVQRRQAALKKRDPNATLYFLYRTAGDNKVRTKHKLWADTLLPVDHPFWDTHYPPNGYGCRCYIRVISQREFDRRGLKVSEAPLVEMDNNIINPGTGEIYPPTPRGIDVGFGHHHGKAAYFPNTSKLTDDRLGKAVTQISVDSSDFDKLIKGKIKGTAPVGFINEGVAAILGTQARSVLLTDDVIEQQRSVHNKIRIDDYRRLPDVFDNGLVLNDSGQTVFYYHYKKKLYKASVRIDGDAAYLESFALADESELSQKRKTVDVLREEL